MAQEDLIEVGIEDMKRDVERLLKVGRVPYLSGPPGVGKSAGMSQIARRNAQRAGCLMVDWNNTADEHKRELAANVPVENDSKLWKAIEGHKKYPKAEGDLLGNVYIFADMRLYLTDVGELRGLPGMEARDEYVQLRPFLLFRTLAHPRCQGLLFLDELSLTSPDVMSAAYTICHDRAVGELTFSENVSVAAAGNRQQDGTGARQLPTALRDRLSYVWVRGPDSREWTSWATSEDLDDRVVGYVASRPDVLRDDVREVNKHNLDKFASPRSWARVAENIADLEEPDSTMRRMVASEVGHAHAREFCKFVELSRGMNARDLLKNPAEIKELPLDKKWALLSTLAALYREEETDAMFAKIVAAFEFLDADFQIVLIKLMQGARGSERHKGFYKRAARNKTALEVLVKFDEIYKDQEAIK